ncbi:tryptophan 7-halogenase [Microbulbifer agarilyticus]|uniref:tryptophan 7-halogenase n=1 Tax=Microbulbifer agarilyticus TaxID=260552 RepID=UPI001CD8040B|nr:tryptophan 7-halogenase [Microbulbifer agarilyticus]MCA0892476.1 tryptophan 7-halogenase [Microbulbifer agarilyticus]
MKSNRLNITVVGNNPSAWYTLLFLTQQLPTKACNVTLIAPTNSSNSPLLLTEDTALVHGNIGIDPVEFIAADMADILLACAVTPPGSSHAHEPLWLANGGYGFEHHRQAFFLWWQRSHRLGMKVEASQFNIACLMAQKDRYLLADHNSANVYQTTQAGLQCTSKEYCEFLSRIASGRRLNVIEQNVQLFRETDDTRTNSLQLEDGRILKSDLIVDCDGQLMHQLADDHRHGDQHYQPCPGIPMYRQINASQTPGAKEAGRKTFAQLHLERTSWQLKVHGQRFEYEIQAELQPQFQNAWVQNILAMGPAWADPGYSTNPLAVTQFQLQQLLPLLNETQGWQPQQKQFNIESALYRDEVNDLQNLCNWLAGQTGFLTRTNRHRLALLRACGQTPQTDHEVVDKSLWQILPTFAGVWPRKGSIPEPGNDKDYANWLNALRPHYQQAAQRAPAYTDYLATLPNTIKRGARL